MTVGTERLVAVQPGRDIPGFAVLRPSAAVQQHTVPGPRVIEAMGKLDRGYYFAIGTPEEIADRIERWVEVHRAGRLQRRAVCLTGLVSRLRRAGCTGASAARPLPRRVRGRDLPRAAARAGAEPPPGEPSRRRLPPGADSSLAETGRRSRATLRGVHLNEMRVASALRPAVPGDERFSAANSTNREIHRWKAPSKRPHWRSDTWRAALQAASRSYSCTGFPTTCTPTTRLPRPRRRRHRVLVPYLRGYGRTRFRETDTPRLAEQAAIGQDVIDFADALRLDRIVVCRLRLGRSRGLHRRRAAPRARSRGGHHRRVRDSGRFLAPATVCAAGRSRVLVPVVLQHRARADRADAESPRALQAALATVVADLALLGCDLPADCALRSTIPTSSTA